MKKFHVYIAYGSGTFPNDMLRYDQAILIAGPVAWENIPLDIAPAHGTRWGYYILASERPPTIERWNSFLWGIEMVKGKAS